MEVIFDGAQPENLLSTKHTYQRIRAHKIKIFFWQANYNGKNLNNSQVAIFKQAH